MALNGFVRYHNQHTVNSYPGQLDTRAIRYCDEYMIWSEIKRLFGG